VCLVSCCRPDALPVTFASVSLAPVSPVPAAPLSTNTVTVSLEGGGDDGDDDEIAGISSSLGVSELSGTLSSLGAVSAVSLEPTAQLESTTAAAYQVLELKDVVDELRRELEDKNQELRSKNDELTCLSASLLEKEKLIRGGEAVVCWRLRCVQCVAERCLSAAVQVVWEGLHLLSLMKPCS
jgi:hypothetical protein